MIRPVPAFRQHGFQMETRAGSRVIPRQRNVSRDGKDPPRPSTGSGHRLQALPPYAAGRVVQKGGDSSLHPNSRDSVRNDTWPNCHRERFRSCGRAKRSPARPPPHSINTVASARWLGSHFPTQPLQRFPAEPMRLAAQRDSESRATVPLHPQPTPPFLRIS